MRSGVDDDFFTVTSNQYYMDGKQIDQFDGHSESSYGSFNPNLEVDRQNLSDSE